MFIRMIYIMGILSIIYQGQQNPQFPYLSVVHTPAYQIGFGLLYPPYGGYYGLVVITPPRPQTLHRSHDNLKNPYRIASIFYM